MILEVGNKLLLVHRRLFKEDLVRFFVGTVDYYQAGITKITGYSFARNPVTGEVRRKDDARTKLVALTSGTFLAYQLPTELQVDKVQFHLESDERLIIRESEWEMDLSEAWALFTDR